MALALNNLKRIDMPLNKETKPVNGIHLDKLETRCKNAQWTEVLSLMINPYLPNPSAWVGYDTRSIFKRSLTSLNSEFSFS